MGGSYAIRVANELSKRKKLNPNHEIYRRFHGVLFHAPATSIGEGLLYTIAGGVMGIMRFFGLGRKRWLMSGNPSVFPNQKVYDAIVNDPLTCMFQIVVDSMTAIVTFVQKVGLELKDIDYPFLIFHGTKDPLLQITYSRTLVEVSKTEKRDKKMVEFESGHCFMVDDAVSAIWKSEIHNWLSEQISISKEKPEKIGSQI